MSFRVRMGVPEIEARWKELEEKRLSGTLNKEESRFFKKWIKAVGLVERNPRHPSLSSHEIEPLTRRYGERVWQSFLENNTPAAGRIFWDNGPGRQEITIIGLEPHPEDRKRGGYDRIHLSDLPPLEE